MKTIDYIILGITFLSGVTALSFRIYLHKVLDKRIQKTEFSLKTQHKLRDDIANGGGEDLGVFSLSTLKAAGENRYRLTTAYDNALTWGAYALGICVASAGVWILWRAVSSFL